MDNKYSERSFVKGISVVIAARNEEEKIKKCLDSLKTQNFDGEFEVIVINDASSDNTLKILEQYSFAKLNVHNLETGKGKKTALNLGISKAKFERIALTDADCVLPPNWLAELSNHEKEILIGPVRLTGPNDFLSSFQKLDFLSMQGITFGFNFFTKSILNNGANFSFNRTDFKKVNGLDNYNTPSGDDVFLLDKFRKENLKINALLNKESIVETKVETSFIDFTHQRVRWASKSKFYTNPWGIFLGFFTLLIAIVQLFIYSQILFVGKYWSVYIILLASKWMIDFILLFLVADFYNQKKGLRYFLPIQLLHPLYIVGIGFASFFMKYEWKGRTY